MHNPKMIRRWIEGDIMSAYGVEPHFVDVVAILVAGELYAPLPAIFVGLVLPSRYDILLRESVSNPLHQRRSAISIP